MYQIIATKSERETHMTGNYSICFRHTEKESVGDRGRDWENKISKMDKRKATLVAAI